MNSQITLSPLPGDSLPPIPPLAGPVFVLVGPTAIGKTDLSLKIAQRYGCEIVGLDSMQIYRYMDIGTAKPSVKERDIVPHHCIDFVDPAEHYHVGRYREDVRIACRAIFDRGNIPLLVGGTGLYLRALLEGIFEVPSIDREIRQRLNDRYQREGGAVLFSELQACDPETASRLHPNDRQRLLRALEIFQATGVPWSRHLDGQQKQSLFADTCQIGLTCDRERLYRRINRRVEEMVRSGLVSEVESLLAKGYSPYLPAMQSIGYRHIVNFLNRHWSWDETLELLARDTRRYAKRQYTWFKRDPKINWHTVGEEDQQVFYRLDGYLAARRANP